MHSLEIYFLAFFYFLARKMTKFFEKKNYKKNILQYIENDPKNNITYQKNEQKKLPNFFYSYV